MFEAFAPLAAVDLQDGLVIGGIVVVAVVRPAVCGGFGEIRRVVVSGLYVRCGRERDEFDRHEFPPGQARYDRHRQDHGQAGGAEYRPAAGHEHGALGSTFPGGG